MTELQIVEALRKSHMIALWTCTATGFILGVVTGLILKVKTKPMHDTRVYDFQPDAEKPEFFCEYCGHRLLEEDIDRDMYNYKINESYVSSYYCQDCGRTVGMVV